MYEASTGYYKIGVSKTPIIRERTLQSQKPDIELLFIEQFSKKEAYKFEKKLHNYFKKKRLRGEWFSLSEKDVDIFLKQIEDWKNKENSH